MVEDRLKMEYVRFTARIDENLVGVPQVPFPVSAVALNTPKQIPLRRAPKLLVERQRGYEVTCRNLRIERCRRPSWVVGNETECGDVEFLDQRVERGRHGVFENALQVSNVLERGRRR